MTTPPPRSYTRLAVAIVAAALIIGSFAYLTISPTNKTVTSTLTESCDASSTLHCVVFQQIGACSPHDWFIPWTVTIGNVTKVQPEGTPLPLVDSYPGGTSNRNFTVIVFSLPDGIYHYMLSPYNDIEVPASFIPHSGVVNVHGTSVLIEAPLSRHCTTTTNLSNPPSDPVSLARSKGDWKFGVRLDATRVASGQEIGYSCYLTNLSDQTQTIIVASPLSSTTIDVLGGQQVWMSEGSATNAAQNISAGQTLTYQVTIPTSELRAGQIYVLNSYPNVLTDTNPEVFFGQQLLVNTTIIIT